ncbi:hypothetical protein BDN72DRAFT_863773 [Pluteus cervinus]|uniref:Uncharacterized protein n=1 Tax=Pluteus cervinus TaxID=181527 RepID=A0ACD3A663_9AGAR|nr:hypothetical protein BDN72DRAFT_863773 [Pluteus cervinus]
MGRRWTTQKQRAFLLTKVKGFIEARARGRSTAYAKSIHKSFSERWPEQDELFPPGKAGARKLNPRQLDELEAFKENRRTQVLTWLQRNSAQRGRLTGRAVQLLVRKHRVKRKRAYQAGEIYNLLYHDKVHAAYLERKTEGLTSGKRLNLLRKISDELLENETDEVKEEVAAKQAEKKKELTDKLDAPEVDEVLAEVTAQEYIEDLPAVLSSILDEVGSHCPDWTFQLIAAGPTPKAENQIHVFDGPKTLEGYSFSESYEGFDEHIRGPLFHFARGCFGSKAEREKAARDLEKLNLKVDRSGSDSEDDDDDDEDNSDAPLVKPRRSAVAKGTADDDDDDDAPLVKLRRSAQVSDSDTDDGPLFSDREDLPDITPATSRRAPPPVISTKSKSSNEPGLSAAKTSKKVKKHDLEMKPIDEDDSSSDSDMGSSKGDEDDEAGGDDDEDSEDGDDGGKVLKSRLARKPRAAVISDDDDDEDLPIPSMSSTQNAKKRDISTQKRLVTLQKNKTQKEAQAAKKRDAVTDDVAEKTTKKKHATTLGDKAPAGHNANMSKSKTTTSTSPSATIPTTRPQPKKKFAPSSANGLISEHDASQAKTATSASTSSTSTKITTSAATPGLFQTLLDSRKGPSLQDPTKSKANARKTTTAVPRSVALRNKASAEGSPVEDDPGAAKTKTKTGRDGVVFAERRSESPGVHEATTATRVPPRRPVPTLITPSITVEVSLPSPSKPKGRKAAQKTPEVASTSTDPVPAPKTKGKRSVPLKHQRDEEVAPNDNDAPRAKRTRRAPVAADAVVTFAKHVRAKRT